MSPAPHPLIVSFLGWSNSGKTTLIVGLVEECRRRNISCAAAKVTRHAGDLEPAGKDSARFRAAGASPVAFIGTGPAASTALFLPTPSAPDRAWIEGLFPDSELILLEGLEVEGSLLALVDKEGEELKRPLEEADILITERDSLRRTCESAGGQAFGRAEARAIVDTLEKALEEQCKGK